MKLNIELVKELLIYLEDSPNIETNISNIKLINYTEKEILYHIILLIDGKYIRSNNFKNEYSYISLTLKGLNFLQNIKNKYLLETVEKEIKLHNLNFVSLDIIEDYANNYIRKILNI